MEQEYIYNIKDFGPCCVCNESKVRSFFIENKVDKLNLKLCCIDCGNLKKWDYHEKVPKSKLNSI